MGRMAWQRHSPTVEVSALATAPSPDLDSDVSGRGILGCAAGSPRAIHGVMHTHTHTHTHKHTHTHTHTHMCTHMCTHRHMYMYDAHCRPRTHLAREETVVDVGDRLAAGQRSHLQCVAVGAGARYYPRAGIPSGGVC